ncbi:MAG: hypothetical protein IJ524_07165 [Bacteroidales bacterium]|nr:hypothetical protein [Bacteroidales bacterium]
MSILKHLYFSKLGGVATVSIGQYKNNPKIGGDFRIGVTKASQNRGYGRLCILYAFSQLAAKGLKYGESAIMLKRKESLYLHYSLGFHPQNNTKYMADANLHPWIKNLNLVLKLRLRNSYHNYLKLERKKYLV